MDKKSHSARLVQSELGCQEPGLPWLWITHSLAPAHTASLSLCQLSDGHRAHGLNPEGLRGMTEASLPEASVSRHTSTQWQAVMWLGHSSCPTPALSVTAGQQVETHKPRTMTLPEASAANTHACPHSCIHSYMDTRWPQVGVATSSPAVPTDTVGQGRWGSICLKHLGVGVGTVGG